MNTNKKINKNVDSKIQSSTDKMCFRYRHTAFNYRQVRSNQIVEHSADNETVLDSSRKQGGAAEHLTGDSEKRNCRSRL